MDTLVVRGARQHNLANVDCEIPRQKLVVITGPSGSGKSSLAFDTIYAEGQRRYVESLSVYARQFLDQLPKPDVDSIDGLSPAIAIEQGALGRSPRSTVGTVTEIADYLRLLFARVGTAHCPRSGRPLRAYSVQEIVDLVLDRPEDSRVVVLGPVAHHRQGDLSELLNSLRRQGYVRVRIDGETRDLAEPIQLAADAQHDLYVVVDRISVRSDNRTRLTDSVELALTLGEGTVLLDFMDGQPLLPLSDRLVSWEYGITLPPLSPRFFSFNSPEGACPACGGLGTTEHVDPNKLITDPSRSLREGAIGALGRRGSVALALALDRIRRAIDLDFDLPWQQLPEAAHQAVLFGSASVSEKHAERVSARRKKAATGPKATGGGPGNKARAGAKPPRVTNDYPGLVPQLQRLWDEGVPEENAAELDDGALSADDVRAFLTHSVCAACDGTRLRPEARGVTVAGRNISNLMSLELADFLPVVRGWLSDSPLGPKDSEIAKPLLRAVAERLGFLVQVGLGTLTLDRRTQTLSGGEAQRIRLATQIGSALVGVLYVLDEPSAGLHPRDNAQLLSALRNLVDRGNSVLLVEHDRDAILAADHVIDMGPGAGRLGGRIVASGSPAEILRSPESVTGPYLEALPPARKPNPPTKTSARLTISGARANNLKAITVEFPLGRFTAVTGVSGSGKSSLVIDTLLASTRAHLRGSRNWAADCETISGLDQLDRVIAIDQTPIGRTPKSTPATATGLMELLRELYASLPEARARGYKAGRFSFNVKGGRCEKCLGDGLLRIEMQFLPDLYVECDACRGKRYNRETLELTYRGLNIADALACTVEQAEEIFQNVPKIAQRLSGLRRAGLGYIHLGQSATTLSGGEAQRLKLARELWKQATGKTLYVLDEPTTGLHFADTELLTRTLLELVEQGNTVVVIEHNMDLVACADWVIDLGPDGGREGGLVVAQGTPAQVAESTHSHTAPPLARALALTRA